MTKSVTRAAALGTTGLQPAVASSRDTANFHSSQPLLTYNVSVYRRPAVIQAAGHVRIAGIDLTCLDPQALTRDNLFDVTFDEVLGRLAQLPRTDVEPDGFFVRTGEADGRRWCVNGHLFELDERLWRMDLHGESPVADFNDLLRPLGWPEMPLVFQLLQHGITVDERDFRRHIVPATDH